MEKSFRIILFLFTISCFGQEGVTTPIGTLSIDVQNGTYMKDVNEEFNPFIGTYIGHWDNKKFTLVLRKMDHIKNTFPNGDYYYEDIMVGKYEIVDEADSSVLYSTMEVNEYDDFPISNMGSVHNGELKFSFYDIDQRCNNKMELELYKMTTQGGVTTVRYSGRSGEFASMKQECMSVNPDTIPKVLPYGFLTLTKVN